MTRAAGTIAGGIAQLLAAVLFPAAAAATTIFTDFGPGQSFASTSAVVNGPSAGAVPHVDASIFQPSGTFTLTSIDLAVSVTSGTDSFIVEIADNNPGMIGGQPSHPGTVLESFTLSNIPSTGTVETLTSILHPTLSNGAFYWIAVFPGGATTLGHWFDTPTSAVGADFSNDGGTTWGSDIGPKSAFDVIGDPVVAVPEPSSGLLLVGGLAALAAFRRSKDL